MDNAAIPSSIRSCDGCTACCYTHAVGEIKKYEFSACESCDPNKGCTIYDTRPRACGSYFCLWVLEGVGNDTDKPSEVGVVCNTIFTQDDPPAVLMMEVWPGASLEAPATRLITELLEQGTSVRVGIKDGNPRYQYHVRRDSMKAYGELLESKSYKVIWH